MQVMGSEHDNQLLGAHYGSSAGQASVESNLKVAAPTMGQGG